MPPLLDRLRRAFLPKAPLYRRESGAGRRVVLVFKLIGAGAVFGVYLFWSVMAQAGRDAGEIPIYGVTVASIVLCIVALALGVQAMRGEVTGGTAESLVLTPLDRRKLVLSKLAGSGEMLMVAALLLPLYCFTLISERADNAMAAYAHGGLLRGLPTVLRYSEGDLGWLIDTLVGLGGFAADLSWYALFAAVGLWAAASNRNGVAVWLRGLTVSTALLAGLGFVEFAGLNPSYSMRRLMGGDILDFDTYVGAFMPWIEKQTPPVWLVAWWLISLAGRGLLAWLFLRRAARRFDLIATDAPPDPDPEGPPEIKGWALAVAGVYGLALVAVSFPVVWAAFCPDVKWSNFEGFRTWVYWAFIAVMVAGQALLLLVPVRAAGGRLRSRRPLIVPITAAAFFMALLTLGLASSACFAVWGDGANAPASWGALAAWPALWIFWGWLFRRVYREASPDDLVRRLCAWLLHGSILELLVAVPSHVVVRGRQDCCAPAGTFLGIATGISVMMMSFGPGIFWLFAARRRRLRPGGDAGSA